MSSNSNGQFGGNYGNRWKTVPNGGAFFLFLDNGMGIINPPLNGSVSPNVVMTPGTYNFQIFGENVSPSDPFNALNLFFNGDNVNPKISVYGAAGSSAFFPNSSPTLANTTTFLQSVPGSGTPSFVEGNLNIALTAFTWSYPGAVRVDRVSADNVRPNGVPDAFGRFSLQVSSIPPPEPPVVTPEPAPALLGALGFAVVAGVRSRIGRKR